MKYDINYTNTDDPKTRRKAINDAKKFYGGGKRWEQLIIILTASIVSGCSMGRLRLLCSMAGIQGYPVIAIGKYITETLGIDMPEETEPDAKEVLENGS